MEVRSRQIGIAYKRLAIKYNNQHVSDFIKDNPVCVMASKVTKSANARLICPFCPESRFGSNNCDSKKLQYLSSVEINKEFGGHKIHWVKYYEGIGDIFIGLDTLFVVSPKRIHIPAWLVIVMRLKDRLTYNAYKKRVSLVPRAISVQNSI